MGLWAIAALFCFGGFALIERKYYGQGFLTVGTFYALVSIFARFGKSLCSLFDMIVGLQSAGVKLQFLEELLNLDTNMVKRHKQLEEQQSYHNERKISLQNVSFQYGGK